MNLFIFLSWNLFLACQTVGSVYSEAKQLEEDGQLAQAFEMYTQLEREYPGTFVAKKASSALQNIYLNYAKEQEDVNPEKSVQLYQKIMKRWPQSTVALLAEKKIEKVQNGMENQALEKNKNTQNREEIAFCERARSDSSRSVWLKYKQEYPEGICLDEANEFLKAVEPKESDLNEIKELMDGCQKALKTACEDYKLPKTTSDKNACNHSNRSFMNEMKRLVRRKSTLLKNGNEEYYQNFVPKRWNAVKSVINSSCQETTDFLTEKESLGINIEPLNELIKGECSVCLEIFGNIEDL